MYYLLRFFQTNNGPVLVAAVIIIVAKKTEYGIYNVIDEVIYGVDETNL